MTKKTFGGRSDLATGRGLWDAQGAVQQSQEIISASGLGFNMLTGELLKLSELVKLLVKLR